MKKADIGLVGLAVMGENLVMNMESKGFSVAVYNRTLDKVDHFINGRAKGHNIVGCHALDELKDALDKPRKVMLMVKAGQAVDDYIEKLLAVLEPGDVIIDGGNSHFPDTIRRTAYVESKGLLYIGTGVSGGEEGALKGPSMMPGGSPAAWPIVKPIFQAICAKVEDGSPCCDWVGENGAGHFVKMVHNGIEYGDMQLICEAYALMRAAGLDTDAMAAVFDEWNRGELRSYLIEITARILAQRDPDTGVPIVDVILDNAGQKGTGQWTLMNAAQNAVVVSTMGAAVDARVLSSMKATRLVASTRLQGPEARIDLPVAEWVELLRQALYASKIVSYAQGLDLMRTMSAQRGWNLDLGAIARLWRGGCIIRAQFLNRIAEAHADGQAPASLMLAPYFETALNGAQPAWRRVVAQAMLAGVPVPAMSASLAFFDAFRSARLPADLLQAQRDFFGAHTYERLDRPAGQSFHTVWPEVQG